MDFYEELVFRQLCHNPANFVSWQYSVFDDKGGEFCPDFLVVNAVSKTVCLVEVTSKSDPDALLAKVRRRKADWYPILKQYLTRVSPELGEYKTGLKLFIRNEDFDRINNDPECCGADVEIIPLEAHPFPWDWNWPPRKKPHDHNQLIGGNLRPLLQRP